MVPTVNRNVSVNRSNAIASEDVSVQAGMELAVRAQVKISFYFKVSETVLCFWEISGLNPYPCFFERHKTCDREQSERHRAQLRRHIHRQLLCVRPACSFTWGNNPGQTRQNHCLCELERSEIILTLFQHKFLSSNLLQQLRYSKGNASSFIIHRQWTHRQKRIRRHPHSGWRKSLYLLLAAGCVR